MQRWSNCGKLWTNKFTFQFWALIDTLKIIISEYSPAKVISNTGKSELKSISSDSSSTTPNL